MKNKGMVVKIKESSCIVLAPDGTYHRVPTAGRENVRVGAELEFSVLNWSRYLKPALMAASLLILVLGFSLYWQVSTPATLAYVSLDINPSVEIEVDQNLKVLNIRSLNQETAKLLAGTRLLHTDLNTCVQSIVAAAAREGYLKPGQKNYVLSAITLKNQPVKAIDYNGFTRSLQTAVENKGLEAEIIVLSTNLLTRNEAKNRGLSTGKLAVYTNAVASGAKISIDQVKENSLNRLVNVYHVNLRPANDKLLIKELHIPPGPALHRPDGKIRQDSPGEHTRTEGKPAETENKADKVKKIKPIEKEEKKEKPAGQVEKINRQTNLEQDRKKGNEIKPEKDRPQQKNQVNGSSDSGASNPPGPAPPPVSADSRGSGEKQKKNGGSRAVNQAKPDGQTSPDKKTGPEPRSNAEQGPGLEQAPKPTPGPEPKQEPIPGSEPAPGQGTGQGQKSAPEHEPELKQETGPEQQPGPKQENEPAKETKPEKKTKAEKTDHLR